MSRLKFSLLKPYKTGMMIITLSLIQLFSVSAHAENNPDADLTNWSMRMTKTMNLKMERKLQQIVLEAQILQNLERDSRKLITSVDKDIGCEPGLKISKI